MLLTFDKKNIFRLGLIAGIILSLLPSSHVRAETKSLDAYQRIMESGSAQASSTEQADVKKKPSVNDLPTPPINKTKGTVVVSKSKKVNAQTKEKAILKDPEDSQSEGSADDSYVLQNGDVLTIRIYPEDQYIKGGKMEVSSEGNITLPLVGKVEVAGKNVIDAERSLVEIIDRDYLVNPEVVIEVERHKKQTIVILGQVKKPGPYEMPVGANKLTLLQAIAQAGGFTEVANIKKIKIVRQGQGKSQVISANGDAIISGKDQDIELEPGDAINVSESLF